MDTSPQDRGVPALSSSELPDTKKTLELRNGKKISCYVDNICKLEDKVDAIVNAANRKLKHGGGVAGAISRAAGPAFHNEGQEVIKKDGPLGIGQVVTTGSHDLECKHIINTVGPDCKGRMKGRENRLRCFYELHLAVLAALKDACDRGLVTIALPAISSGIYGMPLHLSCKCIAEAVVFFLGNIATSLQHVHFVDINDSAPKLFYGYVNQHAQPPKSTETEQNCPVDIAWRSLHKAKGGAVSDVEEAMEKIKEVAPLEADVPPETGTRKCVVL